MSQNYLSAQARHAAMGQEFRRKRSRPAALAKRYAAAHEELERAEALLQRATRRWDKARQAERRLARELDKLVFTETEE